MRSGVTGSVDDCEAVLLMLFLAVFSRPLVLASDRAKLFREASGLEKPPHPLFAEVGVAPTLNGFPAEVGSLLSSVVVVVVVVVE
jgi:hypothetical protein